MLKNDWEKIFRWQEKSGWCGPAVIQMALASGGIRRSQKVIAKEVYLPWWGTTQQTIYAYLSGYFKKINFKENGKISDLINHLKLGHIIIVNWWDDLDGSEDEDGHYSLILGISRNRKKLTLGDPSGGRGIWQLETKEFNKRWYDYLDINSKKWIDGWMLWVDPKSKN